MLDRLLIALVTIAAAAAGAARSAAGDEPAPPRRYLRSPELLETTATEMARGDDSHIPVVTANSTREIPGAGSFSPTAVPLDQPAAPAASPAPRDAATSDATVGTPAPPAGADRPISLVVGGCLAALALLIGLWLRIRQSKPALQAAATAPEVETSPAATISFPDQASAAVENPLEALIRNELPLVEERVQIPARIEFYGWPAVAPLIRRDPAHVLRKTTESATPVLAGPHFLQRRRAAAQNQPVDSQPPTGQRRALAGRSGARSAARLATADRRVAESERRPPSEAAAQARAAQARVLACAGSEGNEPDGPGEPPTIPGPLDRALERLLRKQT